MNYSKITIFKIGHHLNIFIDITDNKDAIWQSALGGAASAAGNSIATNMIFGTGQYFDDSSLFGDKGSKPIYRSGGILSHLGVTGINWGKTAYANKNFYKENLNSAFIHEGVHWRQQNIDGFGKFYGKTAADYIESTIKYGTYFLCMIFLLIINQIIMKDLQLFGNIPTDTDIIMLYLFFENKS